MLPATFWRREPSLRLLKSLITANTKHSARRSAFQKDVSSAPCYQIANNDNSHQSRSPSSQDSGLLTYAFCENHTHMHPMNCRCIARGRGAVRRFGRRLVCCVLLTAHTGTRLLFAALLDWQMMMRNDRLVGREKPPGEGRGVNVTCGLRELIGTANWWTVVSKSMYWISEKSRE